MPNGVDNPKDGIRRDEAVTLEGRRVTPMLRQYLEAKRESPGALLLFRMGDFYELFFEDAVVAARELDLTLTSRDKGEDPIPMAGVPHHAAEQYIARLVERGFTVAICDQVEDPRLAKGLVRREITRLVTPGTVSDLEALDPGRGQFVAYAAPEAAAGRFTLALLDLLAGELLCTVVTSEALGDEIDRMSVRELLVEAASEVAVRSAAGARSVSVRVLDDAPSLPAEARGKLVARFGEEGLAGLLGGGTDTEHVALARVIGFAEVTQRRPLVHLAPPRAYRAADFLMIDEASRRNLELVRSGPAAERRGSLLWHLDRCRTAMGTRLLTHWLLFPLRERTLIERRLDIVGGLKRDRLLREEARELLGRVRDTERLAGRVAVGRATPRDLAALRETLVAVPELKRVLGRDGSPLAPTWTAADEAADLCARLVAALVDVPPLTAGEGGIFRRGYASELDELMSLTEDGHTILADIERRERARTGITNLKVRFNKVFGYYIEVTKANLANVPADYVRKQTLVGAERFITEELKRHEEKVFHAEERRRARETALFEALAAEVGRATGRLRTLGRLLAETDALCSLAQVADEGRYERPETTEELVLELEASRHPVLERLLPGGERFVPNDLTVAAQERQLAIITGPNMAGKSTVMRQAALCTLLAHMGSFVPAKRARVGLCDRIFTRVGASDNLSRGQSTFMVEMVETAAILAHATAKSLVLLDEIGRGTSTFDGVSIAWAVAEHLHDAVGCRTLFATHYHELTDLALERPRIVNMSVAVKEHDERIVFLRRLVEGAANRSYGIQVARLAGLPASVLDRAREILANLESGELDEDGMPAIGRSSRARRRHGQLALFGRPRPIRPPATPPRPGSVDAGDVDAVAPTLAAVVPPAPLLCEIERELLALDPLHLTPIEALATLDRLRRRLLERAATKE